VIGSRKPVTSTHVKVELRSLKMIIAVLHEVQERVPVSWWTGLLIGVTQHFPRPTNRKRDSGTKSKMYIAMKKRDKLKTYEETRRPTITPTMSK